MPIFHFQERSSNLCCQQRLSIHFRPYFLISTLIYPIRIDQMFSFSSDEIGQVCGFEIKSGGRELFNFSPESTMQSRHSFRLHSTIPKRDNPLSHGKTEPRTLLSKAGRLWSCNSRGMQPTLHRETTLSTKDLAPIFQSLKLTPTPTPLP